MYSAGVGAVGRGSNERLTCPDKKPKIITVMKENFLYVNDKLSKALINDNVDPNSFLGQGGLFVAMFMLLFAYVVVEWSIGYWQFKGKIPENRISVFKWRLIWIFLIVNVLILLSVAL